jgi:hypothetical protein
VHLLKVHLEEWTKSCADMGITITAATALKSIKKLQGQEMEEGEHPPYSKQGFVDALIDFIVGDDVVSDDNCIVSHPL